MKRLCRSTFSAYLHEFPTGNKFIRTGVILTITLTEGSDVQVKHLKSGKIQYIERKDNDLEGR